MNFIHKVEVWGDTHQSKWFSLIRVLLGMIILFKGINFIQNTDAISTMIANSSVSFYAVGMAHIVALAHLMGGLLIILGLLTRVAVSFQIPILLGAVIFINAQRGFFSMESELGISLLVLGLLFFFLIYGSGSYSVDEFMKKHKNT